MPRGKKASKIDLMSLSLLLAVRRALMHCKTNPPTRIKRPLAFV
ncbi:MAG: hypothetical protein ACREHG_09945 [Candidatus Saccharimonadales bacterium]